MTVVKKNLTLVLTVLAVAALFTLPVAASGDYSVQGNPPEKHAGLDDPRVMKGNWDDIPIVDNSYKVHDFANTLSQGEQAQLEEKARQMINTYGTDIVIVTTDNTLYRNEEDYIADFYEANAFGTGPETNGVMFIIAFDIRKFNISTHGEEIKTFEKDIGWMLDDIGDVLAQDSTDAYGAATAFLNAIERVETKAVRQSVYALGIGAGASLVFALGILALLRVSHKGSLPGALAGQHYIPQDKLQFHVNSDSFVNTFTTRTPRPTSNSGGGSGGGGGSRSSSSGSSFGGGSRSF